MSSKQKKTKNRIERREFLKFGASGIAVYLSGCAPKVLVAPATGAGEVVDPKVLAAESWQEPWIWRPEAWPEDRLILNVVRSQNPGMAPSPGNPTPMLFSYDGTSPAPTVRVRSDGVLRIKVRNHLGLNASATKVGPCPDPVDMTPALERRVCALAEEQLRGGDKDNPRPCNPFVLPEQLLQVISPETRNGWSIKGHVNGRNGAHTTNLHTHGLHVFPQRNPDGEHSDDVHLRVIPHADWEARLASDDPLLHTLGHNEHVGSLNYKMQLPFERDGKLMPHPPGTHWYHPHSHGSTADQVASGMAGFLIVEGDVDDAINLAMTGHTRLDPEMKTGPYDYRERLIFIQRVLIQSLDADAGPKKNDLRAPPFVSTSGPRAPGLIRMRPGTVERWRVLNGSVDGAGTKRFMVLDGHFVQHNNRVWRVAGEGGPDGNKQKLERVSEQDIENAKLDIHQLSMDGITLVCEENGSFRHGIRDLSKQNAGTENPFAPKIRPGENEYQAQLRALESVFRDGDSLRRAFVRPNEVYLTNANRTDLFFKAPLDAAGRVFTIIAKEAHIHTDNFQRFMQKRSRNPEANARRELFDVIVGHNHVDGDPVEGGDFDVQSLNAHLPPVPPLLWPVGEDELVVPADEAEQSGAPAGSKRCRTISYSGIGGADFPLIEVPEDFAYSHPELENLVWATHDGIRVLLPNLTASMAINTEFDLAKHPAPQTPRKFMPADVHGSRMLLNTAEEWVVYNSSMMMWANTDLERYPQPGSYGAHYHSYPLMRSEGQRRHAEDPSFMISAKANDHPFHIHINPMWVLRIDVPDENGQLHNILPAPIWMDTVAIPRQGGRIVFRSRFDDFVGTWVNHCHVLSHEDNGMMQEVDAIYPKPSLETMYQQNMSFIDPNDIGYQVYPGFALKFPKLN